MSSVRKMSIDGGERQIQAERVKGSALKTWSH